MRAQSSPSAIWLDILPEAARRAFTGEFGIDPIFDAPVYAKVREYHQRTEAFDRMLPHYRGRGVDSNSAIPAGAWARAQSNRYASSLRKHLGLEFSSEEWVAANSAYVNSGDLDRDLDALPWPGDPHRS